jgi:hypothetical protein
VQLALPLDAELEHPVEVVLTAGRLLAGQVRGEPFTQLVAEGLLIGGERQVHGGAGL